MGWWARCVVHVSTATRRQRENIFVQVLASAGEQPFGKITARLSIRTESPSATISVAGKRDFQGGEKNANTSPEPQISGLRDEAVVQKPRRFGAFRRGDTINWGIFNRHFWGELLRYQQLSAPTASDAHDPRASMSRAQRPADIRLTRPLETC
jgi:hypothetical protein